MLRPGMLIADTYLVMEEIGSGGMSKVYLAQNIRLKTMRALKELKQEDLAAYDRVFVFTDAPAVIPEAVLDLQRGLKERHCPNVHFFYSGQHV